MGLQFAATRFEARPNDTNGSGGISSGSGSFSGSKSGHMTLLSTPNLSLTRFGRSPGPQGPLAALMPGETLDGYEVGLDTISVVKTSQRILICDSETPAHAAYPLEFPLDDTLGQSPLVTLVPNPSISTKPHLAVLNPTSGALKFIEALNFVPSLTVVQNESTLDLDLHSNEVVTAANYESHIGLLVSTSQKRLLLVTFFDALGNIHISFTQIFSDRSLLNCLLSRDITTKQSIVAVRVYSETPVVKRVFVLENNRKLVVLSHIVSSGIFKVAAEYDLRSVLDNNGVDVVHDFQVSSNGTLLHLLGSSGTSFVLAKLCLETVAVLELHTVPGKYIAGEIHTVSEPTVFLLHLNNGNISRIVILDTSQETGMNQSFDFKEDLSVFSIASANDKSFKLCTNDGVLTLDYYATAPLADAVQSITSRIEQYLHFNYEQSPLSYAVPDGFSLQAAEEAVQGVASAILNNTFIKPSRSQEPAQENLLKRIKLHKNLVAYVADNCTPSQGLIERLLLTSSLLAMAYHFLDSMEKRDLVSSCESLTVEEVRQHVINNTSDITNLVLAYIDKHYEDNLANLANVLNDTFAEEVGIDHYVKASLDASGLGSPLFVDHFELLERLNKVVGQIDSEDKTLCEAKFGLSLVLYHGANEAIIYARTNSQEIEALTKFLNVNAPTWVQTMCELHRQEEVLETADGFGDVETLAVLVDTMREEMAREEEVQRTRAESLGDILFDLPAPMVERQRHVEAFFETYFAKYEYVFASALFSYYVSRGYINHMLSNFAHQAHYLDRFLEENYAQGLYKFGWICDVRKGDYDAVATRLVDHTTKFDDAIVNKQVMLSIAKLAGVAGGVRNTDSCDAADVRLRILSHQLAIQTIFEDLAMVTNDKNYTLWEIVRKDARFASQVDETVAGFESHTEVPLLTLFNAVSLALVHCDVVDDAAFDNIVENLVALLEAAPDSQTLNQCNTMLWRRVLLRDTPHIASNTSNLAHLKYIQCIAQYKDTPLVHFPCTLEDLKLPPQPDFDAEYSQLAPLVQNWPAFASLGAP